jgi:hypothetical protein
MGIFPAGTGLLQVKFAGTQDLLIYLSNSDGI